MMHMMIAVPVTVKATATLKARALYKTANNADMFGEGQKYINTLDQSIWYVLCGPIPDIGYDAVLKFRDNNIPEALIELVSLEFNPSAALDQLAAWNLKIAAQS